MTTSQSLYNCLGVCYQHWGPNPMHKTAAAYFQSLTQPHRDAEVFGPTFVKLATLMGDDPWTHAFKIARNYDSLQKTAHVLPLSRFYIEWGEEMEKNAVASLGAMWNAAKATGARLAQGYRAATSGGGGVMSGIRSAYREAPEALKAGKGVLQEEAQNVKRFREGLNASAVKPPAAPPAAPTGAASGDLAEEMGSMYGKGGAGAAPTGVSGAAPADAAPIDMAKEMGNAYGTRGLSNRMKTGLIGAGVLGGVGLAGLGVGRMTAPRQQQYPVG